MTHPTPEAGFRQAAEAEGGMPVSAGARVFHVRSAVEAGRALYIDLSSIPGEQRPAVVAEIKEVVQRAVLAARGSNSQAASDVPEASARHGTS